MKTFSLFQNNDRLDFTPEGGQILQWTVENPVTKEVFQILYRGTSPKRTGIPLLIPGFENDIPGARRHGFGRDSEWKVGTKTDESVTLTLNSNDVALKTDEEYPLGVEFKVTYSLAGNGILDLTFETINNSDQEIKTGNSIHPYFSVSHQDKPKIMTEDMPGFDAGKVKWDLESPDLAYPFNRTAVIHFPKSYSLKILDTTSSEPGFNRMQVWSRNPDEDPENYDFVCFEPLGKVKKLKPKESLITSLRFEAAFPKSP